MFTYEEMEKYLAEINEDVKENVQSEQIKSEPGQEREETEKLRREKWEIREKNWKMQKKREKRLRRQCMVLGAAAIILAASAAFSIYYDNRVANTSSSITKVGGDSTGLYGSDDESTYEEPRIMTQQDAEAMNSSENLLLLVNKDNPLPENFSVDLHYLQNGACAVAECMYDALSRMLSDGSDEGLSFVVASGYRDTQLQQQLLEEDIAATMEREGVSYLEAYEKETRETMPPGYSEHETGLAVDIVSVYYQMLDDRQEMTQESRWLRENCSEYGFILRYPKGKEDITGIDYESWHFRYVGEEAAKEIMSRGITLEEYLEEQ